MSTLVNAWDRMYAFDLFQIGKSWSLIESKLGKLSIPQPLPDIKAALSAGMSFNDVLHSFIDTLLDGMKYSVLKRKLNIRDITINAAHIEMAIIINQFELAFSSGKIPPDSLVLDSNHGVAVEFCNVFVTKDTDFVNSLNRIKGSVKINFDICTKPEQLRKKLGVQ